MAECVEKSKFRQALRYRLNVIELRLPPLRGRLEDVGLLAEVILKRLAILNLHLTKISLTPEALQALRAYTFAGNVREMGNILERASAFANDGKIEVVHIVLKITSS
ncbi:MAG: hypothetical protein H7240_09860 [Glaciimonas sp.]|nr:hypothetical protein [Glaciimonas sp.]